MQDRTTRPVAEQTQQSGAERRVHERFEIDEIATIKFGGITTTGSMSDLSVGGAMLEGDFVVGVETGSELRLSFGDLGDIRALVVYVGETFCGVQFIDAAKDREAIHAWLRRQSRG